MKLKLLPIWRLKFLSKMGQIKKDSWCFSVSCCVVNPSFCEYHFLSDSSLIPLHRSLSFSHNPDRLRCMISQKFALLPFGSFGDKQKSLDSRRANDTSKVAEPGRFWSAMQRLEETELRKADRTVGVNCYIFSNISSGTGIGKLIDFANHNWAKLGLLDVTTGI